MVRFPLLVLALATAGLRADDRKAAALDKAALAHAYGERCPGWKVDWLRHVQMIEAAGLLSNSLAARGMNRLFEWLDRGGN